MRPVEAGSGQEADRAPVQPGMHPVPVEFDLMQPVRSFRRLVDEFGQLWFDPTGERRRFDAPVPGERSRHSSGTITGTGHEQLHHELWHFSHEGGTL
jgi:hypothetical protein